MMIAPRSAGRALALVVSLGVYVGGSPAIGEETEAIAEDCRSITLVDAASGREVRGAEDIEVVPGSDLALVSAYDRWALEDAIDAGAAQLPQGALYAVDLTAEIPDHNTLTVEDLTTAFKAERDFHPHGLSILESGGGARVFVVNHRYERETDGARALWRYRPTVEVFDMSEEGLAHRRSLVDASICHPNNLVALGPTRLLVSNDHGHCGRFGAWLEDILPLRQADLVHLSWQEEGTDDARARIFAEHLRFANGIAANEEWIVVAETRDDRVQVFRRADDRAEEPAEPVTALSLPAGPDNLTWWSEGAEGRLVSAAHPRLLRLGFYAKRWFGVDAAPSRVLAVDVADGSVSILYDDPEGRLISAASGAVVHKDRLVIGSPFDTGLVMCRLPGPSGTADAGVGP